MAEELRARLGNREAAAGELERQLQQAKSSGQAAEQARAKAEARVKELEAQAAAIAATPAPPRTGSGATTSTSSTTTGAKPRPAVRGAWGSSPLPNSRLIVRPLLLLLLLQPSVMRLDLGAHMVPHVDKVDKGGEDAYYISPGNDIVVVADGVGAWGDEDVDPAAYSQALVERVGESSRKGRSLVDAIDEAHRRISIPGSATVCAFRFDGGKLTLAALGDSQVKVVRGGLVAFATEPLQHEFNMPYQLGSPKHLPDTNYAKDAVTYEASWPVPAAASTPALTLCRRGVPTPAVPVCSGGRDRGRHGRPL